MSIVVCVKVYDGIVLGSESMTQLWGGAAPGQQSQFVKAFGNARKLFRIGKTRFGALTYGAGNLGHRSMESYFTEFSEQLEGKNVGDIEGADLAEELRAFLADPYQKVFGQIPNPPLLGVYLAGYSPKQHVGTEWEFTLSKTPTAPSRPRPDDQFGASWRGVSAPFSRLFFGVDGRVYDILKKNGINDAVIQKVQAESKSLMSPIVFDGMPLQDAVGFCRFILETTIGSCTYETGIPTCGGPIHIAVIRRSGFEWISEPKLSM